MATELAMDIAVHIVQALLVEATAIGMRTDHQVTKPMGMEVEEALKVSIAAIPTVRVAEETSITMAVLSEEEGSKILIKMVAAPSAIATIRVNIRVMVSEAEVATTTVKVMVGDEDVTSKAVSSVRSRMYNLT